MSIQIKTTEGILTLSNATDVRKTGVLVVRGHKGVTLGYVAPVEGGWIGGYDLGLIQEAQAIVPEATPFLVGPLEVVATWLVHQANAD
jgi:hypothetical protein